MKKIIFAITAVLAILPMMATAQIVGDVVPNSTSACVSITHDLQYRSRDAQTGGDVSTLQVFLQSKGYLNSEPTGYFGILTQSAVKKFQSANGILSSGYFGPITRGKLVSALCAGNNSNGVTPANKTVLCPNGNMLANNCTVAPTTPIASTLCPNGRTLVSNCLAPSGPGIIDSDARIKSTLSSARASAEISYAQNNQNSYNGICLGGVINSSNPQLTSANQTLSSTNTSIKCYSSSQKYTISANLSNGTTWCIDSTGVSSLGSADSSTLSCKTGQTQPVVINPQPTNPTQSAPVNTNNISNPSIKINSPTAGQSFDLSTSMSDRFLSIPVSWTLSNKIPTDLYLDFDLDNSANSRVAHGGSFILSSNGFQSSGLLLDTLGVPLSPGQYTLRATIKTADGATWGSDTSSLTLIKTAGTVNDIKITNPQANAVWNMGGTYTISWTGPMQQIMLQSTTADGGMDPDRPGLYVGQFNNDPVRDGSFSYTVAAPAAPGHYTLEVVSGSLGTRDAVDIVVQ